MSGSELTVRKSNIIIRVLSPQVPDLTPGDNIPVLASPQVPDLNKIKAARSCCEVWPPHDKRGEMGGLCLTLLPTSLTDRQGLLTHLTSLTQSLTFVGFILLQPHSNELD